VFNDAGTREATREFLAFRWNSRRGDSSTRWQNGAAALPPHICALSESNMVARSRNPRSPTRGYNMGGYSISVSISPAYFHSCAVETSPARTGLS
jgi:hypothetical protein